ncbi:reverse transcriptase domain-containing protein [Tanacetum coccineum]
MTTDAKKFFQSFVQTPNLYYCCLYSFLAGICCLDDDSWWKERRYYRRVYLTLDKDTTNKEAMSVLFWWYSYVNFTGLISRILAHMEFVHFVTATYGVKEYRSRLPCVPLLPSGIVTKVANVSETRIETTVVQMLERLAGNEYYCFLDRFSGYFQIPIDPLDQEKTTFTCPYGTFAYRRMPFGLCNAPGTFQRCMVAIFHNMKSSWMISRFSVILSPLAFPI